MVASPLFTLQDIAFERDDLPLFEGVSATLYAGDILQLNGPNGCGKTTLLHILATLKPSSRGQILWRGEDVRGNAAYLAEQAFIGHQPGVKLALSARENLVWYARLYGGVVNTQDAGSPATDSSGPDNPGTTSPVSEQDIDEALDRVGLDAHSELPCSTYSAGQLRRVALAGLYLRGATVWLLDEPLTALDTQAIAELESLFRRHLSDGGIIVFSSHQTLGLDQVRQLVLSDHAPSVH